MRSWATLHPNASDSRRSWSSLFIQTGVVCFLATLVQTFAPYFVHTYWQNWHVLSNFVDVTHIFDLSYLQFVSISLPKSSPVAFPNWPTYIVWNFSQSSASFWIGISLMRELIKARPLEGVRLWQTSAIWTMNQTSVSSIGSSGPCGQDTDEYQIAFYNLTDILSSKGYLHVQFSFSFLLLHWPTHLDVLFWHSFFPFVLHLKLPCTFRQSHFWHSSSFLTPISCSLLWIQSFFHFLLYKALHCFHQSISLLVRTYSH